MPPDHCRSCGAKVVLAYDVRDNVLVAIVLGFTLLAAVQKRSPGYSVFLPGSFVFLSIFVWLIYAAKFKVDPAPKYLQYFILLALFFFFFFWGGMHIHLELMRYDVCVFKEPLIYSP